MSNQIAVTEVAEGFRFALTETFESVFGMYLDKGNISLPKRWRRSQPPTPPSLWATAPPSLLTSPTLRTTCARWKTCLLGNDLSYINWETIWQEVSCSRRGTVGTHDRRSTRGLSTHHEPPRWRGPLGGHA